MKPEDIRKLYHRETEATAEEAAATRDELRSDPNAARSGFDIILALADGNPAFYAPAIAAINAGLKALIRERMRDDDEFACYIGGHLAQALTPPQRTPRGKPGRGTPNKMA